MNATNRNDCMLNATIFDGIYRLMNNFMIKNDTKNSNTLQDKSRCNAGNIFQKIVIYFVFLAVTDTVFEFLLIVMIVYGLSTRNILEIMECIIFFNCDINKMKRKCKDKNNNNNMVTAICARMIVFFIFID